MRVLVIEDEKEIAKFLEAALKAECFSVDTAEDGERGSYLARTNEYALIVLDNILPKRTGLEICQDIRKADKNMPIIMLSVKSDTATKVALLNAGADDYLIKPFSLEELLARMRALLRRPKQIQGEAISVGDLTLNSRTFKVSRGKKEIYLTRKEFMLLEYLMRNQGAVLSRGMILERVWDMDTDPFSNTIESHILSIRKKVDSAGNRKLIQTVPGRGYTIDFKSR